MSSDNTYITKTDGDVVISDDPNQYKTGLTTDILPRASSGAVEDNIHSFGDSTYRWLKSFLKKFTFGDWVLEDNAGAFSFVYSSSEIATLDTGVNASEIKDKTVTYPLNDELSSNVSYTVLSSTSSVEFTVTNLEVTIVTTGGPVMLTFIPGGSDSYIGMDYNTGVFIQIYRNGTLVNTNLRTIYQMYGNN